MPLATETLEKFCREAKKYGILYCVLKDKTANDGHTDVFVRAEDASKINRIFDRFGIATADIGSARTEIVKAKEEQKNADIPIPDRSTTEKDKEEAFLDALLALRPIRRRRKRKTPRKARLRNPVRPSLHQISARKPSGVSLIQRNAPAHLSGRK